MLRSDSATLKHRLVIFLEVQELSLFVVYLLLMIVAATSPHQCAEGSYTVIYRLQKLGWTVHGVGQFSVSSGATLLGLLLGTGHCL